MGGWEGGREGGMEVGRTGEMEAGREGGREGQLGLRPWAQSEQQRSPTAPSAAGNLRASSKCSRSFQRWRFELLPRSAVPDGRREGGGWVVGKEGGGAD